MMYINLEVLAAPEPGFVYKSPSDVSLPSIFLFKSPCPMKSLLTALLALSLSLLFGQNTYHRITEVNNEQRWLRSPAAQVSGPATSLLIYQYGGATLFAAGGMTGQVDELGGAGHYDLNRVARVNGDTLFLNLPVKHDYNLLHSQLVLFESTESVTVTGVMTTDMAFDGSLGGITFIAAGEQIRFESGAFLNAAGAGFRGGEGTEANSDCNRITIANGLIYGAESWRGSSRGEGVGDVPIGQPFGRAAAANGGGGGNDHNAGGGGGGNITKGGAGARNVVMGFFNTACRGNYPGLGGLGLDEENERVYFGGGGGAGHANNSTMVSGGNGGGLIILWAPLINFGLSSRLTANGTAGANADGDGGGGGGAAGTVLLASDSLIGRPDITLEGGNGGDVQNRPTRCFGPGGGGGGGQLLTTARSRAGYDPDISLNGGTFGKRLGSNECGPNDEPAGIGEDGEEEEIPPIIPFAGFVQNTDTLCGGAILQLTDASSGATRIEWAVLPQSDDLRIDQFGPDLRVTTTSITEGTFRAIQTLFVDDISYLGDTAVFTVVPAPGLTSVSIVYGPEITTIIITEAIGFDLIRYDFGDGTVIDTSVTSLSHTYAEAGDYSTSVTLLNNSCGDLVIEEDDFMVSEFAAVETDLKFAEGCAPLTFTINDRSSGTYEDRRWTFPGGSPETSNQAQTTVTYTEPGEYDIVLTLLEAVGSDTIRIIPVTVYAQPVADISVTVDTASATFNNSSLDGVDFFWDFGDSNTSMEESPTHTYGTTGTYEVTFLVENGPCQDSSTLEVVIDVLSGLVDLEGLGVRIFPNPTSGQLTLTGPARISGIYDLTGRQVMGGGERSHDLSALPAGVYMVGVLAGGRTHWVRIVRR